MFRIDQRFLLFACIACGFAGSAGAGGHTWDIKEIFSDASGTLQFIRVFEANGTPNETATANHMVTSNSNAVTITSNVAPPTTNKSILLATAAFAAIPGAPTPNYIIPPNFFSTVADSIAYTPYDVTAFGAGQLPIDGIHSFVKGGTTGPATPRNYAGQTWAPPGVPDGSSGLPLRVEKFPQFPDGSRLSIHFDAGACALSNIDHQIVYGFGSDLPASPGASFDMAGARCNVGTTSPVVWPGVPDPATDPTGLLFLLVIAENDGGTEGSWGHDSNGAQRIGPMIGGASGQCGNFTKSLVNTCGQ